VFAVQDEITEQVVGMVAGSHGVISRARFADIRDKPTDDLDAYESVLQAAAYYRDNMTPTQHARVRGALEQAVQSDPAYADAWAYLADVYLDEYRSNYNPRPDPLDRALSAARRAVSVDRSSQRAHQALAEVYFLRHALDAFSAEIKQAIALNSNDAETLANAGHLLQEMGDERGISFVRKAIALDPFHPTWLNFPVAQYHFERGEYEKAIAVAQKIDIPGNIFQQLYLAAIYAELGRQSEAQSAVKELLKLSPGFNIESVIEERRKWNPTDDSIRRWVAALRKAGLPEGTEA
jgi:Tfp pilus assembly protein PilF